MAAHPAAKPTASSKAPLAVDLDGTLMRGDLFGESMLRLVFAKPWKIPLLIAWLLKGRAYAKARLVQLAPFDPTELPYNEHFLAWLRQERAEGRTIVLATASDRRAADVVAAHVGVFDAVFASDGVTNLKSRRKAEHLARAFPEGFAYAGNEIADLKVWARASQAVVVNAPRWLSDHAHRKFAVEQSFAPQTNALVALLTALRPQQWAKNILVFLPLLAGQGWLDTAAWREAAIAFLALCCAASSVYLLNDAADIDADRRHPRKRRRPFADGAISPFVGLAVAALLCIEAFVLSWGVHVAGFIALYLVVSTLYTFWLKRVVLIDVFLLAALYTLRVVLGGAASGYVASSWLLAFSTFFFLSLALMKRVVEVRALQAVGSATLARRGYHVADGPVLTMMGVGASFVSALVLALYTQSETVLSHYHAPLALWALPLLTVFWMCRVWLKTARGEMTDDPLVFAFRDRASLAIGALAAAAFAYAALG
ncbi:MAG TPA: UbiA family prenyltransferase [Caulobacterales bacterium]|nr:UbiA family prenyltransferase [Caulobacterales bacterium]